MKHSVAQLERRCSRNARRATVACVATLITMAILARSCSMGDSITISTPPVELAAYSLHGEIRIDVRSPVQNRGLAWTSDPISSYRLRDEFKGRVLGFSVERSTINYRMGPSQSLYKLLVPIWALVAISLAWTIRELRRAFRRGPASCCGTCGYDLSKTATRLCPECGSQSHSPSSADLGTRSITTRHTPEL